MKKSIFNGLLLLFCCIGINPMAQGQSTNGPVLNHIAVHVHNLAESTSFYKETVGLKVIDEPFNDGKHTWFSIGKYSQFHLIAGAAPNIKHDKNSHLCFSVRSVDKFIKRLEKAGIAYENWAGESSKITLRTDGVKQIYFQDPDGYWVEVNDDRK